MLHCVLEANGLLRHPGEPDVSLTLDDCAELAGEEGEADGVGGGQARIHDPARVFRLSDPAVRFRFVTEDALGWVCQFWQTARRSVNDSGRKIGGADLAQ